jgi:hypothetical protein
MPSKDAHLSAARENQRVIEYLCQKVDEFPGWVATVAFYKALHVIEALFAVDGTGVDGHTDKHEQRNTLLKKTRRYQQLWKFYRPLFQASLVARYLRENQNVPTHEVFATYMPPDTVVRLVLGHYLKQIEKSATGLATAAGATFEI